VQRDGDVFGDGVNVASCLQTLAEPDTICVSQVMYQEVAKKLSLGTVEKISLLTNDLGEALTFADQDIDENWKQYKEAYLTGRH
jgi:class 3 adenylate cyclase